MSYEDGYYDDVKAAADAGRARGAALAHRFAEWLFALLRCR